MLLIGDIFASDRQGFRPKVNIARHYIDHFTVYSALYRPLATCKLHYELYREIIQLFALCHTDAWNS